MTVLFKPRLYHPEMIENIKICSTSERLNVVVNHTPWKGKTTVPQSV